MIVSPSLLSADFINLGRDLDLMKQAGADWLHVDVMDGVFVPNISYGFPIISQIRKATDMPLDVHFMIVHPEQYVTRTRDCGVELMCVHAEACTHLHRVIQEIHSCGMKAGVALNPATPVVMLEDVIEDIDLALVMSVNPGFGGQKFIHHSVNKVRALREMIDRSDSKALIEVDGGVNAETGRLLAEAGADVLVAGSYVFAAPDPAAAVQSLKVL